MANNDFFNRGTLRIEGDPHDEFERMRDELELALQRAATPVRQRLDIAGGSTVDPATARVLLSPELPGHLLVIATNAGGDNTTVEVYLRDADGFRAGDAPVDTTDLYTVDDAGKVLPLTTRVVYWASGDRYVVISTDGTPLLFNWTVAGGFTVEEPATWATLLGGIRVAGVVDDLLIAFDGTDIIALTLTDQTAATINFTLAAADLDGKTPVQVFGSSAANRMLIVNADNTFFHEAVPFGGGVAALVPITRTFPEVDANPATTGYAKSDARDEVFAVVVNAAGVNFLRRVPLKAPAAQDIDFGEQGFGVITIDRIAASGDRVWMHESTDTLLAKLSFDGNLLSMLDTADYGSLGPFVPALLDTVNELPDGAKRLYVDGDVLVELRW